MNSPTSITTSELRQRWLDFWQAKQHAIIPSASVLPDNDPTALFINSGMHPLVPYLMGQPHPAGQRLANAQKCIRTIDIDEVGDATHLTCFEMLGNWSLGDFGPLEMIDFAFAFLTEELGLPLEKLAFSVFAGDVSVERDTAAAAQWASHGVAEARIAYLGVADNWWAKGDVGPCGPDTEIFYWTGAGPAPASFQQTHDDPHWVEIWNCVFMTFDRQADGSLQPLTQPNIDTGMGLERTVAVLNGQQSIYQTDGFTPILQHLTGLAQRSDLLDDVTADTADHHSLRVIADHLRSSCVLIADGVTPSNVDQGYILRRLVRRAIRHGRKLGIPTSFVGSIVPVVVGLLGGAYPELVAQAEHITRTLTTEEAQFAQALVKGEKEFHRLVGEIAGTEVSGGQAFYLYETYGFPLEITTELAAESQLTVDEQGFAEAFAAHQARSRAGSEAKFAGGLADDDPRTLQLHTATHLLHAALRKYLGEHVQQKGSNITPERLRFDFSHPEKLTPEQKQAVEQYVNDAIAADQPITHREMPTDEAFAAGALGFFGHKYGERVTVYDMGEWSVEICGGPHAASTGELGKFRIAKEKSSSKGVRRIRGVLE